MDLARSVGDHIPKKSILIVHSGNAEKHYLFWVARELYHSHVDIRRANGFTNLEMIDEADDIARDAASKSSDYDEVWCVLVQQAPDMDLMDYAYQRGVRLAFSWPDFQTWLRLHLEDPNLSSPSTNASGPATDSPLNFIGDIQGKYESARERAIDLELSGEYGTTIYELIDAIRESLQKFMGEDRPRNF